ncbi:hypothetical protein PENTCL1PPCAC_20673, partial [Pristionchus entomophagus]
ITSPGYPYSAETPCDFVLQAETGKKVQLEIVLLEANSCCDTLTVYEGSTADGSLLATLTGEIHKNSTLRTSNSNVMTVRWQPKGGVNVKGVAV